MAATSREKVKALLIKRREDIGNKTSTQEEVPVSKLLMASKKCVVVAMETTVDNSNSVVGTRTTTHSSSREPTNKSKVKGKERLVTSTRRMTDRSASLSRPKKLPQLKIRQSDTSDKMASLCFNQIYSLNSYHITFKKHVKTYY